jgi:hypothetical protein
MFRLARTKQVEVRTVQDKDFLHLAAKFRYILEKFRYRPVILSMSAKHANGTQPILVCPVTRI